MTDLMKGEASDVLNVLKYCEAALNEGSSNAATWCCNAVRGCRRRSRPVVTDG